MTGVAAVFYRDYRQRVTNWGFVVWDLFVPLAYLLLFGTGFERAVGGAFVVDGREVPYGTFLLPGVIAMTGFTIAMNTSWGFFMDKDSGIFHELLTYPITRREFLIGKSCFNVLLSVAGSLLTVALGAGVMGARVRWAWLPLTVGVVAVSTACWFYLFSILAIRLRRMDSFNTFTSAAYILLMFFSSMFYPLDDLPGWFRVLSRFNPMTWHVDSLRLCVLGMGNVQMVAIEFLAFTGFTALCLALAARALNRAD